MPLGIMDADDPPEVGLVVCPPDQEETLLMISELTPRVKQSVRGPVKSRHARPVLALPPDPRKAQLVNVGLAALARGDMGRVEAITVLMRNLEYGDV